ncbi:MAG: helix-turn-helix domain-containing protein [Bacteroides graminisolvens]|nr:helix-turn-helix domain-containing protein [Bacteroides graminisolvens]
MNAFGEYLRNRREQLGLPLRRVAAELDIDTSILSKIKRSERTATKEMLPILAKALEVQEKEMEG